MSYQIANPKEHPYRAVCEITVTFPDGYRVSGTGCLVGINDVLTALHVVYAPDRGGWATNIKMEFGKGASNSSPYYTTDNWGNITGYPDVVFSDNNDNTMTTAESKYDFALIGLKVAAGNECGWLGLASGYDSWTSAYSVGYPGTVGPQHSATDGLIRHDITVNFDSGTYQYSGIDTLNQGSSGGPLLPNDDSFNVIGVKSSGTDTRNTWADIGHAFDFITSEMDENNDLLGLILGTDKNDVLRGTEGNDTFDGQRGIDRVDYQYSRSNYNVAQNGNTLSVSGPEGNDILDSIERLKFADKSVAFDIEGNAGQAYRLYQAAFDRIPDMEGLGYWISNLDNGLNLLRISNSFINSFEFQNLYGSNATHEAFVSLLYNNVLHRSPDQGGYNYWLNELATGVNDREGVLAGFSESNENKLGVLGFIQEGIEYTLWLG